MKKVLIFAETKNNRVDYLSNILKKHYELVFTSGLQETINYVKENVSELRSIIVDNPSNIKGFEASIEFTRSFRDSFLIAPFVILTDEKNQTNDEKYLDNFAIACISTHDSERVIINRLERSFAAVNSIGFAEFSKMLEVLPSLIYIKDDQGRYIFCSQSWYHIYNHNDGMHSIRGLRDADIRKDKKNAQLAYESDMKVIKSGKGTTYLIREEDGDKLDYLRIIKEPLKRSDGSVKGIITLINNVTEQEELRQQLETKSITDPLTGLYNRMHLEDVASGLIQNERFLPVSLITGDCDGLKAINDKYGHAAGDEYLRMTAKLLKETLPREAIIFRMGGDEFAAFIPNADNVRVRYLLNNLRKNMKKYKNKKFALQASFGSFTVKQPGESIDACLNASDRSMYKNKRKREKAAAESGGGCR